MLLTIFTINVIIYTYLLRTEHSPFERNYMNHSLLEEMQLLEFIIKNIEKHKATIMLQLKDLPKGSIVIKNNTNDYQIYHSSYKNSKRIREYIPKDNAAGIVGAVHNRIRLEEELRHLKIFNSLFIKNVSEKLGLLSKKSEALQQESSKRCNQFISLIDNKQRDEYLHTIGEHAPISTDSEFVKLHNSNGTQLKLNHTPSKYGKGTIETLAGVSVRSKSELIILERLHANGLEFYYEQGIDVNGYTCYPDFLIRHPATKDFLIWEHCGIMNSSDYVESWNKKLAQYCNIGIRPCTNLIISYEDTESIINTKKIQDTINHYFS